MAEWIPTWRQVKTNLRERLSTSRSVIKVILKTKDDPIMLEDWIQHHAKIAGINNLIIFDNCSTSETVLQTYGKYKDEVIIIRHEGFIDLPHNVKFFPELYAALRASCDYYTFLDTDERLVWMEQDRFWVDDKFRERIADQADPTVLPGT
jgi:hypothetical protein